MAPASPIQAPVFAALRSAALTEAASRRYRPIRKGPAQSAKPWIHTGPSPVDRGRAGSNTT